MWAVSGERGTCFGTRSSCVYTRGALVLAPPAATDGSTFGRSIRAPLGLEGLERPYLQTGVEFVTGELMLVDSHL